MYYSRAMGAPLNGKKALEYGEKALQVATTEYEVLRAIRGTINFLPVHTLPCIYL